MHAATLARRVHRGHLRASMMRHHIVLLHRAVALRSRALTARPQIGPCQASHSAALLPRFLPVRSHDIDSLAAEEDTYGR